jgi:anaerobic selenocysteine-containing dehydrogenase
MPKAEGTVAQLMKRLLTAYGSPNYMVMPSADDAYAGALRLTQGVDGAAGAAGPDVAGADFILSFGSALLDGYGSPVQMFQAVSRLKDVHGTLVQVEPRLSNTAAKADVWLAAEPGSEGDLALAMTQVIIANNRYDKTFGGQSTQEFEAFARMVNSRYTPSRVAEKCGIDAKRITKIALAFADANKPLAVHGRGKGQTPGTLKEALAVHTLNVLVGNINKTGGLQIKQPYGYINWPPAAQDGTAAAGLKSPRADNAGSGLYTAAENLPHRFFGNVAEGTAKIQALLVGEANPCYSLPDPKTVKAALDNIPFVVSFSSFMDETAARADLILPNHVYLERYEDVPVGAGVAQPILGLCRPVTQPQHNTRHMGDALIQIAHAVGGTVADAIAWSDYQTCLQETLADQWQALSSKGYIAYSAAGGTAAKTFTFMDKSLQTAYLSKEAPMAGDSTKYPLQLIAFDSIRLASRYAPSAPFMMKTVPDTILKENDGWVEINPDTAAQQGLADGQAAILTTPKGKAIVRVHYNHGLMPGLIAMARGLGHSAYDQFLTGKGTNINSLMESVEDPASGMDAAWGIRAQLAKA